MMAEERGGGGGGGRGRKGRRRYFQPKREGNAGQAGAQAGGQPGQGQGFGQPGGQGKGSQRPPAEGKGGGQKSRRARKRARSRQRFDDSRAVNLEAEVAYVAPQAVYIYEHSAHPELRDTYEFRPEHFSKVGRKLEDYALDLSKLFSGAVAADGTPVMTNLLPKPQYDWSGWEEPSKEEPPKQEPSKLEPSSEAPNGAASGAAPDAAVETGAYTPADTPADTVDRGN